MADANLSKAEITAHINRLTQSGSPDIYARDVLEILRKNTFEHLSREEIKPTLSSLLHRYPTVDLDLKSTFQELINIFLDYYLEKTKWTVPSFWVDVAMICESSGFTINKYSPKIAASVSDWVIHNQNELEKHFKTNWPLRHLQLTQHPLIQGFSSVYRAVNDDLFSKGQKLNWSEDFIISLYKGLSYADERREWAEYENLSVHTQYLLTILAIKDTAYENIEINAEWFERKSNNQKEKEELIILAASYGYTDAYRLAEQNYPSIAKQIDVGWQLELSNAEIYDSVLLYQKQNSKPSNDVLGGLDLF